ncbi:MAG: hypothetical protein K5876_05675 [Ruminiclostridium sp.]|nr:hypothetical protein [Ruminiclostridium sp.]
MKFRKLFAGIAAAAVAASAVAVSAGAELIEVEDIKDENGLLLFDSSPNSWMPIGYSNGERDTKQKAVIDYGVDWSKANTIEVVFKVDDQNPDYSRDDWDGGFGGAIVLSSQADGNTTHNWNAKDFWGVIDEDLELETIDENKALRLSKVADYTYMAVCPIDDDNFVVDNAQLVQICIQDWSGVTFWGMKVMSMEVKDESGNVLIAWDENGKCSLAPVGAAAAVEAAPVEAAPADTSADVSAASAGDTTAAVTSSKGSPDTGIADVAAVAGLAVLAGGAFVIAKKRK